MSTFHKDNHKKPLAISLLVNTTSPITRPTIKYKAQAIKQIYVQLAQVNGANKRNKKRQKFQFLSCFWFCFF